jgi:hypothetical protein
LFMRFGSIYLVGHAGCVIAKSGLYRRGIEYAVSQNRGSSLRTQWQKELDLSPSFGGSDNLFYFDATAFVKELSSGLTEALFKKYTGIEDSADNLSTLVFTGQASVIRNNPDRDRLVAEYKEAL